MHYNNKKFKLYCDYLSNMIIKFIIVQQMSISNSKSKSVQFSNSKSNALQQLKFKLYCDYLSNIIIKFIFVLLMSF
jgi:hypothetical protein